MIHRIDNKAVDVYLVVDHPGNRELRELQLSDLRALKLAAGRELQGKAVS